MVDVRPLGAAPPPSGPPPPDGYDLLRDDIRLLGRVLGDVIRDQAGDPVFALVERTRVEALRLRREGGPPDALIAQLDGLGHRDTLHIVRAFSHFSLLANLAEDLDEDRRRRRHRLAGRPPAPGSVAGALDRIDAAGLDGGAVAEALRDALVSPVMTAHPTEVRRKTVFEVQRRVVDLIRHRDRTVLDPDEQGTWDDALWRTILTLWQTALLRLERLRLSDEISEGLQYYRLSLFEVMPDLDHGVRRALQRRFPDHDLLPRPMLRPGSWIGGDRDGNPSVTAASLDLAVHRQAATALAHYLDEVVSLGVELSMSIRLVHPTPSLLALADAAGPSTVQRGRALPTGPRGRARPPRRHRGPRHGRGARRAPGPRPARALRRTRRPAGRPRHGRRLAARARGRGPGRRPPGAAAPRGRRVRVPPRAGSTCARARRCTSVSSPTCCGGQR